VRVHVSDPAAASDLRRHLVEQGFPASGTSSHELDVLFPGGAAIFPAAVELDLWSSRHAGVHVVVLPDEASS
jgi:hypothetical protein